jgi:cell division transport system permease protein
VYLRDGWTPAERADIEKLLRDSRLVRAVELVSKEEALRASIEVRLLPDVNPGVVEGLAQRTASLPGVSDVRYDRRWIQRLLSAVDLVRAGGFALAGILVFAAALTVASVVRLALLERRDELHIMQLVGAPLRYIRGPFVVEGLIQGGIGAIVAVAVLWVAFLVGRRSSNTVLTGAIDPASMVFLSMPTCAALLAGGMIVGCVGGLIAARSTREIAD